MALRLVSRPFHVVVLLLAAVASLTLTARRAEAAAAAVSISVGGYTLFLSNGTVVDSSGTVVTPTKNADGSGTVGGYTAYSNGTITGPDGGVVFSLLSDGGLLVGGTVVSNKTFTDVSGTPLQPVVNADKSGLTAGDLTVFTNGTMISASTGVIVQPTDIISSTPTSPPSGSGSTSTSPPSGTDSNSTTNGKAASASSVKLGYLATAVTMAAGFAWLLA